MELMEGKLSENKQKMEIFVINNLINGILHLLQLHLSMAIGMADLGFRSEEYDWLDPYGG